MEENLSGLPGQHDDWKSNVDSYQFRLEHSQEHPLYTPSSCLSTKPIRDLYDKIDWFVRLRRSGLAVHGESGAGKSRAIRALEARLQEAFPRILVWRLTAHQRNQATIGHYLINALTILKHPLTKGDVATLMERLIATIVHLSKEKGANTTLILLDESQAMKLEELFFLRDLANRLADCNVSLITVMFGEAPSFQSRIASLNGDQSDGLHSRFFRQHHALAGFSNVEELEDILDQLDTLCFPIDTDWTYTRFFCEHAWRQGFRMRLQAPKMWRALNDANPAIAAGGYALAREVFTTLHSAMLQAIYADHQKREEGPLIDSMWALAALDGVMQSVDHAPPRRGRGRSKKIDL